MSIIDGDSELGRMLMEKIMEQEGKGGGGGGRKVSKSTGKQAEQLQEYFKKYSDQEDFKPGDIIEIKEGFSVWRSTSQGRVMIVIEKLAKPKRGSDMSDDKISAASFVSQYASMLYDIVAAYVDDNGDFVQHYYDSRRFSKCKAQNKIINMFQKGE